MKKLALLLSLLALGALGLVACGGGDDDQTAAASETETSEESAKQVTPAEYAAVEYGQTAAQVRAILGEPQLTDTIAQGPSVCWYYGISAEQTTLRERLRYATQICFDYQTGGLTYKRHGSK